MRILDKKQVFFFILCLIIISLSSYVIKFLESAVIKVIREFLLLIFLTTITRFSFSLFLSLTFHCNNNCYTENFICTVVITFFWNFFFFAIFHLKDFPPKFPRTLKLVCKFEMQIAYRYIHTVSVRHLAAAQNKFCLTM